MEKLTKRAVDALRRPDEGQTLLWDGEMRGFGVRVLPSGLKAFILQYRTASGRSRRLVLGRYGVFTVEQARNLAREKLVAVTKGEDPAEESRQSLDARTVADICDWYLENAEAGRILGRRRVPIKANTLAMDRSRIEQHVKPLIGKRPVRSLTLGEIEGLQADIAAGKTAKKRSGKRGGCTTGGAGVGSRTVSTLHALLEHAVRLGEIERNPARGVRRLAGTPRERRLSTTELVALGSAMRSAPQLGEHPVGLAAVRMLLLTGFRRQEAIGLCHEWINTKQGYVRFPDTKTGAQVRVIGAAAAKVASEQARQTQSPYVFPADSGDGNFTAETATLRRLCSDAGIEAVTPHVLRHTFASMAGELGFSELTIKALLGHSARGVTQRYVHIDEAVRFAADRVSSHIEGLLDGRASPSRRRRRSAPHEAVAAEVGRVRVPRLSP